MCELPYDDLLKQLTTHQHAILIDLGELLRILSHFAKPSASHISIPPSLIMVSY